MGGLGLGLGLVEFMAAVRVRECAMLVIDADARVDGRSS